jgi:VanZ family protein
MLKMKKNWGLVIWIIMLVMVVTGSLHPNVGPPNNSIRLDIILHFLFYTLLSGLAIILFNNLKIAILAAVAMLPMGLLLEIAQLYIKERTFDTDDLAANSIGVLIGLLVGLACRACCRKVKQ